MNVDHNDRWSFDRITENIYLGADLCCGSKHYDFLCGELGVSADIDLKKEDKPEPSDLLSEFLWLPVDDDKAPRQEQFVVGVAMIDAVVRNGGKVYVHCRVGHGRSPTLVAAYFISKGMGVEEAVARVKERRSVIHPTQEQVEGLREYKKNIARNLGG